MKAFATDGSEEAFQSIISKLKFLAALKPDEKIDVASMSVQGVSAIERLWRAAFGRGESRDTTYAFVRKTLNEAFDFACTYLDAPDPFRNRIGAIVVAEIREAKPGVVSLAATYRDDRMFVSRLNTLIATLDVKINGLVPGETSAESGTPAADVWTYAADALH